MREIKVEEVARIVRDLSIEANVCPRADHLDALRSGLERERSPLGREVLEQLLENAQISCRERVPFCQDTGYAVVFVEVGQGVQFVGGDLEEAINRGVRAGYDEGYLRKSIVVSPMNRVNTGDNTPAVVYYELVPGDGCRISLIAKGAGCDNMSAIRMLTPAEGLDAAVAFVAETVERAGPNASPPVTLGVGLGGTFEKAALLAKKALLWPSGQPNPNPELAELEQRMLEAVNRTGIGPAGYGGDVTAISIHIEQYATHIAALPVAVNLDCHAHRVRSVVI